MNTSAQRIRNPRPARRHLAAVPSDQSTVTSLEVVDLENLLAPLHGRDRTSLVSAASWVMTLIDGCTSHRIGVVAANGLLCATVAWDLPKQMRLLAVPPGSDSADRALTRYVDSHPVDPDITVIYSGDHHFVELARQARFAWVIAGTDRLSSQLAAAADVITTIDITARRALTRTATPAAVAA
ncbi:hypothetical protein DVS28_b0344 (plasmid) [Euzebya pacifica]|uniref:NYN domain-containing protein n=1 Tax=Euzebya pacifica TaxID=1608957 RepID=A0A346Y6L7_9ACTN|nr:hypothetical protein [Euzebya pacifica]AXV10114.1 hypothetical protein DVS28_b0344 [Euzebya pacifica]